VQDTRNSEPNGATARPPLRPLTLAVPKGRILKVLAPLLRQAGISADCLLTEDRRLVRENEDQSMRFLLLKPDDVPTYVEYGSADLGVVGRDTLLERNYELYQPVDLRVGACRMVVAAPMGAVIPTVPRVATKYPRIAQKYFASRGMQAEVIFVQGSVELAPVTGLADLIVDLVETGTTLRENGLEERELICPISSLLVANRSLFKLHHERIAPLVDGLRRAVEQNAR
jgi:ATP phosphoribosyltransferase